MAAAITRLTGPVCQGCPIPRVGHPAAGAPDLVARARPDTRARAGLPAGRAVDLHNAPVGHADAPAEGLNAARGVGFDPPLRQPRRPAQVGSPALTWARVAALGVIVALMARISWLSDDALITVRTALNLVHGWGPGFNATESVAGYTHPLWFLLVTAGGAATGQWLIVVLALALACAGAATALVLWAAARVAVVVAAASCLALSDAFMEYSTSGLENPLAYFTAGLLLVCGWPLASDGAGAADEGGIRRFTVTGLLAGALALTRLDLVLLMLPAAGYVAWRARSRRRALGAAAAAFVGPFVLWLMLSLAVYGQALPNTFQAKRNLDIPQVELVVAGLRYLVVTADADPVTALTLVLGLAVALIGGTALVRAWAAGVLLYVGYVVWIGGDFMAGRFLAVPVYVTVLLLVQGHRHRCFEALLASTARRPGWPAAGALLGLGLLVALTAAQRVPSSLANPTAQQWALESAGGVADERGFYVANGRGYVPWLMTLGATAPAVPFADVGGVDLTVPMADLQAAVRAWPDHDPGQPRLTEPQDVGVLCGRLGTAAVLTGPTVHWIDQCALTDRFLAEQPFRASGFRWRAGHFERTLPSGYEPAVRAADPAELSDPRLREQLRAIWREIR